MTIDEPLVVELCSIEMLVAAEIGVAREVQARRRNNRPLFQARTEQEEWGKHIVGALAECAVAKVLGIYWPMTVGTYRWEPDIGKRLEVRWSSYPALKVHQREVTDDIIVIAVTGKAPHLCIPGWCHASDAPNVGELRAPRPDGPLNWFVPHGALASIDTLRPILAGERADDAQARAT